MSKHTPGPWALSERAIMRAYALEDRHYIIIAEVFGSRSNPQALADARLIAAASFIAVVLGLHLVARIFA